MGIVRQQRKAERTSARVGKIAGKALSVEKKAKRNCFVRLVYVRDGESEFIDTNLTWGEVLALAGTALNQVADKREMHRVSTSLEMARACIREQGAMIASLSDRLSRKETLVPDPIGLMALREGKVSVNAVRASSGLVRLSKAEHSELHRKNRDAAGGLRSKLKPITVGTFYGPDGRQLDPTTLKPKPRRRKA